MALALVAVAFLVRSPATIPQPAGPGDPFSKLDPGPYAEVARHGTWSTVGTRAPINLLNPGPAVWTGEELLVGFTPDVAAFSLDRPPQEAWRQLPPHPGGALDVVGAVAVPRPGGPPVVAVFGHTPCAGCGVQPSLWTLDAEESWRRHPSMPLAMVGHQLVAVPGHAVVVGEDLRGRTHLSAFDIAAQRWRPLVPPPVPDGWSMRLRAVGVGPELLVYGRVEVPTGYRGGGAWLSHGLLGDAPAWRDVSGGLSLTLPDQAAAVWTGQSVVLLGGGSHATRGGRPVQGMVLDLQEAPSPRRWRALPQLPLDSVGLQDLGDVRSLQGLSGAWDGERAVFVGGLRARVHVAWSPDDHLWEVRQPTIGRAGGALAWTGERMLLWGGVTREGPAQDLQYWPTRLD